MPSTAMTAKLNEQITHEFHASQHYLAMACATDAMGLKVVPRWFREQAEEEREHALKILDYLLEVGARVKLAVLPPPPSEYKSVLAAAEAALKSEKKVTKQIHDLVALADKEKDYATRSFLNGFVDEQVEELKHTGDLLQLAKMAGDNLLQLESHLRHAMSKPAGG